MVGGEGCVGSGVQTLHPDLYPLNTNTNLNTVVGAERCMWIRLEIFHPYLYLLSTNANINANINTVVTGEGVCGDRSGNNTS